MVLDLEEVADMKRTDEIWLLLVRRVKGYVDDDGILKRPYLLLLYEIAPNTILRNHHIVLEHRLGSFPKPEFVLKMIIETIKTPLEALKQPPHRPASLIFTSQFLYNALTPAINKMRILPKLWTEEENQGFGDDFVAEISKKLVDKKGFGEGRASHQPGLLSMTNVTPEVGKGVWRAAAEFFNEAPWKTFTRPHVFTISWKEEVRLFTVTGKDMEPGIIMETKWSDMRSLLESRKKPINGPEDYYCVLIFTGESGIPFADLEAAERYEWPLATRSIFNSTKIPKDEEQASCFPLPACFPDSPPEVEKMFRPKRWELLWFEVACKAIARFTREYRKDEASPRVDLRFPISLHSGNSAVRVCFWDTPERFDEVETFFKNEQINVTQSSLACVICNKLEDGGQVVLKRCGTCKKKLYCSRECQMADWKAHKPKCTPPTASTTTAP